VLDHKAAFPLDRSIALPRIARSKSAGHPEASKSNEMFISETCHVRKSPKKSRMKSGASGNLELHRGSGVAAGAELRCWQSGWREVTVANLQQTNMIHDCYA